MLVIALDGGVAKWCAQPIALGPSGSTSNPLVLGPEEIPRIDDESLARAQPELAVLAAAAHAGEPESPPSVAAAILACEGLDAERATLYADLIFWRLGEATLHALEALMQQRKHSYQSEFANKYFTRGREEGLADGREEGLAAGREEERRAVLRLLLQQRFGALPEDVPRRIDQADMGTLEKWIERVILAQSLTDVFADG